MGMRTMLTRLAGKLDLPTDIAAGLPRIALNGFSECSLDRHRGILEYSTERIVVALNIGELTVEGAEVGAAADAPPSGSHHGAHRAPQLWGCGLMWKILLWLLGSCRVRITAEAPRGPSRG